MNWKIVFRIIGQLVLIEASLMALCLAMSLWHGGSDARAFAISVATAAAAGSAMCYLCRKSPREMSRRDSYVVVTLVWVVFSIFGALPYLLSGHLTSVPDAYFETMSGFSTTGASLIDDVESLPRALLFWRSMTQWIGGLGIVFFTIAIIPSLVGGSVKVFGAEATGPMRSRLHPKLSTTGRWIWGIYLLLTIACATLFHVEGMSLFDAVNYAMTVTATGGFATHNASTGYFHSLAIDYTAIAFMLLCGTSFTLLYIATFKRRPRTLLRNTEFRLYLSLIALCTAFIMAVLMRSLHVRLEPAFRVSLFQVVSFITTTGIFNTDAGAWPHITWVTLLLCMFVGGCSGSTAGGFKCVRAVMLYQVVRNELRRLLHPNAVLPVKVNSNVVPYAAQATLLAYLMLYLALCFFTYFMMTLSGIDSTNSFTIAISCASNVGPSLSLNIGEPMSWAMLPAALKWLLSLLMLMGRLEILSVAALFTPYFWRDR